MLDRTGNSTYIRAMANNLATEKKVKIINLLVEGMSIRAITRVMDVSKNTVANLLIAVGKACQQFHDEKVVKIKADRVQCDEIWSFVYAKDKNVNDAVAAPEKAGDCWTWVGIDADTKLAISWLVASRDADSADVFMKDVASRLTKRVQLTTDGLKAYLKAVEDAFTDEVDYAQLVKLYGDIPGAAASHEKKYSPAECTGCKKTTISGTPREQFISTSYIERQNLTMRMHMRRFTRLTNAFSKKIENHCHAIALHFVYYNWCKIHTSLRVTPAMQANLIKKPMTLEDIVNLIEQPPAKKRGAYKKREISN